MYHEHKPGSCPVHGHGAPTVAPTSSSSESPRSHSLHVRGDSALATKMTRPGEYKGMFLPAHEVPMLHPYLVHPPRDAPYPLHPMDRRHAEFVRERERQVGVKHAPSTDIIVTNNINTSREKVMRVNIMITNRAVKKFFSSRLIMNSRQLCNSYQRYKFLRAKASRDILKFRVLEMPFL